MLNIHETPCRLGKFSNNLDKHGEDDYTAFDVPVVLELPPDTLNDLMEDRLFSTRLFDSATPGNPITVGGGFLKVGPLKLRDTFEETQVDLLLSSSKSPQHYEKCKISKIMLQPCLGGTTECAFSMHVQPNTDKEILQLLHHQRRDAVISISGGKLIQAKKQQELGLVQGGDEDESETVVTWPGPDGTESNVTDIR